MLKLADLTETQFRALVGSCAVLLVLAIISLRFCGEIAIPKKPPKPVASVAKAREFSKRVEQSAETYATYLAHDSRELGADPPATPESMSKAFEYRVDRERRVLRPGKGTETADVLGLSLRLSVEKIHGTNKKQMVLNIDNPGDEPLAYRIVTKSTRGTKPCHQKRPISHNALAIAARGSERRSECIYRKGWGLVIESVETLQLPELGYLYLSSVDPTVLGIDGRVARGHRPATGKSCRNYLSAGVERALEAGRTTWRDLADFFARHRCQTYRFPSDYRAFERDGERSLPASAG